MSVSVMMKRAGVGGGEGMGVGKARIFCWIGKVKNVSNVELGKSLITRIGSVLTRVIVWRRILGLGVSVRVAATNLCNSIQNAQIFAQRKSPCMISTV
jgi:hypothetical protein